MRTCILVRHSLHSSFDKAAQWSASSTVNMLGPQFWPLVVLVIAIFGQSGGNGYKVVIVGRWQKINENIDLLA